MSATPGPGADTAPTPRFFAVSAVKLSVLSIASLGMYDVYWFYQQWKFERAQTGEPLSLFWRAFFSPLFAYSLFKRIRGEGARLTGVPALSAGAMATAYFIMLGCWRLPDPYWLITIFSFLPLLPAQRTANAINAQLTPEAPRNDHFSGANVALIIFGTLILALTLLGLFLPPALDPLTPMTAPLHVARFLTP
ncbi:MAG: hypothetical protein R2910_02145 [Gemmatimonadales bacterium]